MKLRLSDLESARRNPVAFRQGDGSVRTFGRGMSKNRALQLAVFEFHRRGNDLNSARAYLQDTYHRNFKREDRLSRLEEQLEDYAAAYLVQGHEVIETRVSISIPIGNDIDVTGQVPRLDLDPNRGYVAWFFSHGPTEWREELRMPLLQLYFAERMGASLNDVTVGVYDFSAANYVEECYSVVEVQQAQVEAADLAAILTTDSVE